MGSILEMREITKRFTGVVALKDVNLVVQAGEIHAICGENGAGKSTLMKVLSGVHPHGTYEGQIFYDGEEVKFDSIRDSEEKGIIIRHQELALVPLMTIAEKILVSLRQSLLDAQRLASLSLLRNSCTRLGLAASQALMPGQVGSRIRPWSSSHLPTLR